MEKSVLQQLEESVAFLQSQYKGSLQAAVVLGSGLGDFASQISIEKEISYQEIPNFPVSTVEGHSGKLIFGEMGGKKIMAMAGRFHFYEGYDVNDVIFPIRVMKKLGIQTLFLSNAAGAVNTDYEVGDLMIIKDHIGLFVPNPLVGKNLDELGPRFPDMSEPYKKHLIQKAKGIAEKNNFKLHEGVYVAVTGPTYETRAEYQLIKVVGGDVVGMSTVQECIAANHLGMDVFALSVVTDLGIREDENIITHEEVLAAAKAAEPKMTLLFKELIASL